MKQIINWLVLTKNFFYNMLFVITNARTANRMRMLNKLNEQSISYSRSYLDKTSIYELGKRVADNPLELYFNGNIEGPGIWKWRHYFDIYHRYFEKFIGKDIALVEVGIYSGGSLRMWQNYFGNKCRIYGIDIQAECKKYEKENIRVFIGDQSDLKFWNDFRKEVSEVDIFIDDGSHQPQDQITTLEQILPIIRPGGVYVCEDIQEPNQFFIDYINGLQKSLSQANFTPGQNLSCSASNLQKCISAIHVYPFMVVIEKNNMSTNEFSAPKHGTSWEPFL